MYVCVCVGGGGHVSMNMVAGPPPPQIKQSIKYKLYYDSQLTRNYLTRLLGLVSLTNDLQPHQQSRNVKMTSQWRHFDASSVGMTSFWECMLRGTCIFPQWELLNRERQSIFRGLFPDIFYLASLFGKTVFMYSNIHYHYRVCIWISIFTD